MNNNLSSSAANKGNGRRSPFLAIGGPNSKCGLIKGLFNCFFLSILIFMAFQVLSLYYLHSSFDNSFGTFVNTFKDLSAVNFDRISDGINYQKVHATSAMPESPSSPPPNHPPTAHPGVSYTTRDTPVFVTLRATDQDGDPLTFFSAVLSTKTAHGKLGALTDYSTSSTITTAWIAYFPDPGYTGSDSFTYQAADISNAASNVATINIIVR
jgi:hypothetical protein